MTKPTWLLDFFRAQNETAEACATLRHLAFCLARVGLNEKDKSLSLAIVRALVELESEQ